MAKWLFSDPKVLILDEPTRGIDVGAKYEIYAVVNQVVSEGRGVVMISSEMSELLGIRPTCWALRWSAAKSRRSAAVTRSCTA